MFFFNSCVMMKTQQKGHNFRKNTPFLSPPTPRIDRVYAVSDFFTPQFCLFGGCGRVLSRVHTRRQFFIPQNPIPSKKLIKTMVFVVNPISSKNLMKTMVFAKQKYSLNLSESEKSLEIRLSRESQNMMRNRYISFLSR